MPKNSTKLNQLSRKAAVALFLYAGFILGFCFLVAHFTAWRQSERVAKEPFYTTIPGVNLEQLPPEKAGAVIKKLNVWRCHCGCMRSVASCRNNHKSCTESIVAAQDEANAARPVEAGLIERWRSKRNRYMSQSVCLQNLPAHGPMWDARHLVL